MKHVLTILALMFLTCNSSLHAGAIHEAIWEGDLDKVKIAIAKDPASIMSEDDSTEMSYQKYQPLHLALSRGYKEIVEFLLEAGADPDAPAGEEKVTLMHIAATTMNTDLIDLLIKKGGNVNVTNFMSATPMMHAVSWGPNNAGMVDFLIANKADPMLMDREGNNATILHQACLWAHNLPTVKLLIEKHKMSPRLRSGDGKEPIVFAAQSASLEMIEYLVEKGADPKVVDEFDANLVVLTAGSGNVDLVRWLIGKGGDPRPVTKQGETALHRAVYGSEEERQVEIMKLLVSKGVDHKARNIAGKTALDLASELGKPVITRYLSSLEQ